MTERERSGPEHSFEHRIDSGGQWGGHSPESGGNPEPGEPGSLRPAGQGSRRRRPWEKEPVPRRRDQRVAELIDLYHMEIALPFLYRRLTKEEAHSLQAWATSLPYKRLATEIRKRRRELDEALERQRPRGLAMP